MHTLTVGSSQLSLDLQGGRIGSLILNEIPIFGTFNRLDGKSANTHVCTPNFGREGMEKYGLPAHGPARDEAWEEVDSYESFFAMQYDMGDMGTFPTTLRVYQEFYLADREFTHNVSVTNIGDDDAPVNLGIHYYWHTPKGWESIMLNGANVAEIVRKDANTPLSANNIIEIRGLPKMTLHVERFEYAQLWTGRGSNGSGQEYNTDFVCIEPLRGVGDFFGSGASILPPDRSLQTSCVLTI